MADKKVYQGWRDSAAKVAACIVDDTLALWQKVRQVNGAYAGLALEGLKLRHRQKILMGGTGQQCAGSLYAEQL